MNALVAWDAAPEGNVDAHIVYHGYTNGQYIESIVVLAPTNQLQFTGLDDFREHHFSVKARNTIPLESGFSSDVSKRVQHRLTLK